LKTICHPRKRSSPRSAKAGVKEFIEHLRAIHAPLILMSHRSEPGTEVEVICGNPGTPQKKIRATVAAAPYKKNNRRADLAAVPLPAR
jgi:hypothetical protein